MIQRQIFDLRPGDMFYEFSSYDEFAEALSAAASQEIVSHVEYVSHRMMFEPAPCREIIGCYVVLAMTTGPRSGYDTITLLELSSLIISRQVPHHFFMCDTDRTIPVI